AVCDCTELVGLALEAAPQAKVGDDLRPTSPRIAPDDVWPPVAVEVDVREQRCVRSRHPRRDAALHETRAVVEERQQIARRLCVVHDDLVASVSVEVEAEHEVHMAVLGQGYGREAELPRHGDAVPTAL